MKRLLFRATAATVLLHCLSAIGQAQLVQVGPGYVKAPFVRVYGRPDGSRYVRAPFVRVFTPGYYRGDWAAPQPLPTAQQLADMDWRELRASIRELVAQLDAQLATWPAGDFWKAQLKTAEVRAVAQGRDGRPAAGAHAQLQDILHAFAATNDTPTLSAIAGLPTFRVLHVALVEFSMPPEERLRRQLSTSAKELHNSLDRISTGRGWQKYLALPEGMAASQGSDRPSAASFDLEALAAALDRFDSVSQDDEYRMIADLPAFRSTHQRLAAYLALRRDPAAGALPSAEELPVPRPNSF